MELNVFTTNFFVMVDYLMRMFDQPILLNDWNTGFLTG
jgi:hypothetical protein